MNSIPKLQTILLAAILWIALSAQYALAQFTYTNEPLINIIEDVQKKTPYRFLYREALIYGLKLSFTSTQENVLQRLKSELQFKNIRVDIDSTRKQAVLFKTGNADIANRYLIAGQVIDAETGERLPLASILWNEKERLRGTATNQAGAFSLNQKFSNSSIRLQASYIGYKSQIIEINLLENASLNDITFRLEPTLIGNSEIVVTGTSYYNSLDPTLRQFVDIGTFSPLGETNTIRALQKLPSVTNTTALNDGLNIRGSLADGFRVLLDGITIYNQSHLFGLLDSFNADVLQTGGFFYDVAPAQYAAPLGGTLALITKTGSLNETGGSAGVSNTSYRLTLEGPLKQGQSSWLISGRHSYLNQIDWLNNSDLIELGLDVDRPREVLDESLIDVESRLVKPRESDATFFDLHGKLYFEGDTGRRLILSGYYGRDDTRQSAFRLFRTFATNGNGLEQRPVQTKNKWGNAAASAKLQIPVSDKVFSFTSGGFSIYNTDFNKEDFTYIRLSPQTESLLAFTSPFENKSILNELKAEQEFNISFPDLLWSLGVAYQYYDGEYFEDSFDRPGFFTQTRSHKLDAYTQFDIERFSFLNIRAGSRFHYYSNGDYLKWSPRFKIRFFPESPIAVGAGYSKNYQFLSKISLSTVVSSDVWILADQQNPPAAVDYFSAGIYLRPIKNVYFQAEAYIKDFENLRFHEINTYSLSNAFLGNPFFSNNSGFGRGLELFLKNKFSFFELSQSFTISGMRLENPLINEGESFFADWDRTYRYSASLAVHPVSDLSIYLSWLLATGTPNRLAVFGPSDDDRLDHYQRTDISAEYSKKLSAGVLKARISVYNLTDRENPWYRELSFVVDPSRNKNRLRTVPVDVFDLGFQPSFNVSFSF